MNDLLVVSRWYYPAGSSVLIWLTGLTLLALAAVAAGWTARGAGRRFCRVIAVAVSAAGGLVCLAIIAAEIVAYEFSSPLSVAACAALLAVFAWQIRQGRRARRLKSRWAASLALACVAFAYLFFYGSIPNIVALKNDELAGMEGENVLGRPAGTLPVAEFADFECPPCAAQDRNMDRLWGTYSDRIRYSFRHFPKARHPQAGPAALASQCAAEQGAFWETKRLFFSNQDRLGEVLAHGDLPTIPAGRAQSYAQCVQSRAAWGSVSKDKQWAENLGLRVTPSIIIGNKLIQGLTNYSRLSLIVRRELKDWKLPLPQRAAARPQTGCAAGPATQGCSE